MQGLWKFIFNPSNRIDGTITKAMPFIRQSGYKLFTWNGDIYRVPNSVKADPLSQPLGITIQDIEGSEK